MSTKPKEGEPPIVAQIHMGRLGRILNEKLQTLLDVAHYDPHLDLAAATGALLETAADLNARLIFYTRCPYTVVKMVGSWFPMTYKHAVTEFLAAEAGELDAGFSLPLQELALAEGSELAQQAFLLRRNVQQFLENSAHAFFSNSLPAERAAAEVKRREGRNITLLANVSCDLICRRFAQQRLQLAEKIDRAQRQLKQLKRQSWQAIAWERYDAAPHGARFSKPQAAENSEMPAAGGSVAQPATGGVTRRSTAAVATKRARTTPSSSGATTLKSRCTAERTDHEQKQTNDNSNDKTTQTQQKEQN